LTTEGENQNGSMPNTRIERRLVLFGPKQKSWEGRLGVRRGQKQNREKGVVSEKLVLSQPRRAGSGGGRCFGKQGRGT